MKIQDLENMSVKDWMELINERNSNPLFKHLRLKDISSASTKQPGKASEEGITNEELALQKKAEEIEQSRQNLIREMEKKLQSLSNRQNELNQRLAQLVIEVYIKEDIGKAEILEGVHRDIEECLHAENDMKLSVQLMNTYYNSKLIRIDDEIGRLRE